MAVEFAVIWYIGRRVMNAHFLLELTFTYIVRASNWMLDFYGAKKMKLLTRYEGKTFRNLTNLMGSQIVDVIAEVDDPRDISPQIEQIKRGIKRRRNEEFIILLVRQ